MDTIQRIFERLGLRRCIPRPNALESSPFRELPSELILLITSYLPLESVGSLSLSCLPLYSCLKTEYLQSLKEAESSAMKRFLHLLERDLPAHIICPKCNKLHYIPFAERHLASQLYLTPSKNSLKCRIADSTGHYDRGTPGGFSSTIFRMAMKTHRQGKDTTALLRLLSYRDTNRYLEGFVELYTAEARIRGGSLLVRDQKVFMVPTSQKIPLPWYSSFSFCRHIPLIGMADLYWWGIRVPKAHEIDEYENEQGIIYCPHCRTEFRIDFKSYGKAGNALFVTRWIDFGQGQGRGADDIKRIIRRNGFERRRKVTHKRGSICVAFEKNAEFKFDSLLTKQDEKDLREKPYWTWPDHAKVSGKEDGIGYAVRNGRLVPIL